MMIVPAGVKVHLALGYIDMRKGMDGLAVLVQETLKQDPFSGHLSRQEELAAQDPLLQAPHSRVVRMAALAASRWHRDAYAGATRDVDRGH
jgi:transposase